MIRTIFALAMAAPAAGATLPATPATLYATFAKAAPGDTITVTGAGGQLTLPRADRSPPVTLELANSTWTGVYLVQTNGIVFNDLVLNSVPLPSYNAQAVRLVQSSSLTFNRCRITGAPAIVGVKPDALKLDATGNVLGLPSGKAMDLGTGSRITVRGCDISLFHKGIILGGGDDIVIDGNAIHDLRTTPVSGTPGQRNRITSNKTRDSNPWRYGGAGDHGDRIHLWTFKAGPAPAGLVIAGNDLRQGSGKPMLGIYLDDNGYGVGFPGVAIVQNRVTDSNGQGMRLEATSGQVAWNTMTWTGQGIEWNNAPRILVTTGSHDIVFTGNMAARFTRPLLDFYQLTPAQMASMVRK